MKTYYLIKSIAPFIFLPIAPGVVQIELERWGIITSQSSAYFMVLVQIAFAISVFLLLARTVNRSQNTKTFLRMSCISKKVFHRGKWISIEQYLSQHHDIVVSHGMTPEECQDWLREGQELQVLDKVG